MAAKKRKKARKKRRKTQKASKAKTRTITKWKTRTRTIMKKAKRRAKRVKKRAKRRVKRGVVSARQAGFTVKSMLIGAVGGTALDMGIDWLLVKYAPDYYKYANYIKIGVGVALVSTGFIKKVPKALKAPLMLGGFVLGAWGAGKVARELLAKASPEVASLEGAVEYLNGASLLDGNVEYNDAYASSGGGFHPDQSLSPVF